jgi:glyoxylase-like metal-dependent hydrolase (beta-lactamase superfamily II)
VVLAPRRHEPALEFGFQIMARSKEVTMRRFVVAPLAIVFALLGVAVAISRAQAPQPQRTGPYEVYAVRYGVLPGFRVSGLVAGADPARRLDIPVMFWVIKGPGGRVFLVDCGFYRERLIQQWKVQDYARPPAAIGPLGLQPEDVTDIIITHMHWDHAGSLELFPKATVWIQRDEFTYYTGDAWQPKGSHGGIEAEDVLALVKANLDGRLRLLHNEEELLPGLNAHQGGCHTHASQFVSVDTASGTVVLASDNVYLYENLEKKTPVAGADVVCNLEAQKRILELASNPRLIVPGHDPMVFSRFQAVAPGIVRIQ